MRYQTYDMYARTAEAFHDVYQVVHNVTAHPFNPFSHTPLGRVTNSSLETAMRLTRRYEKLDFDIDSVEVDGKVLPVREDIVCTKPFCNLIHFKRIGRTDTAKVLLVAPLSGHFATLLKGTIEALLPDHEVYVTDWLSARDVPRSDGVFDFDVYTSYLIEFMEQMGTDIDLVAVCQGSVQALMATAVMAEQESPSTPRTLVLMAAPIDVTKNPTRVNEYGTDHSMEWFKSVPIMTVPYGYPGYGRQVYPGFMQLGGFISMKLQSHIKKFFDFYKNLIFGAEEDADRYRAFYDEYLAVLDIPAEFYLETIERVFKNNELAERKITYKGKKVDFDAIKDTALLTIEGGDDDICGLGQTEAAHTLCRNIPDDRRKHFVQPGAGHYGIFSGSMFRKFVRPLITSFINEHDKYPVRLDSLEAGSIFY